VRIVALLRAAGDVSLSADSATAVVSPKVTPGHITIAARQRQAVVAIASQPAAHVTIRS